MWQLLVSLALIPPVSDDPNLSWMSGAWLQCSEGREVAEVWSGQEQGLMMGYNLSRGGTRSGFEYARIQRQQDGHWAYVAQPGGMPPTAFRLVRHDATSAVFANPENDFPHRIVYWREGDRLRARIEAADGDPDRSIEWSFNKSELNRRCPP